MSKKEFAEVMNYLYTAYSKQQNKLQMGVYYDLLGIYDHNSLASASKEWIENSEFFPKIADLIKIIIQTSAYTLVHFTRAFIVPKQKLPKIIHRTAARGESEGSSLSDILHEAPAAL